jgi:hypothetical protein
MRFVSATGVSHGSYSKSSVFFFFAVYGEGHGMKFMPSKNCLGANVLMALISLYFFQILN